MKKLIVIALTALMFAPSSFAATQGKFLRFEMTESKSGESPTNVKVRVPMSLFSAFSKQIDEAVGEVDLDNAEIDLRAVWAEVRAAGPNEFVEVNQEGTYIKVSTTETDVVIVAKNTADDMDVTARFPLELGDLLFSFGDRSAEELINALSQFEGELLSVEGDGISASAWIESN